jgi:predicted dehydrogenase
MHKNIKIAIIGTGFIADYHARAISALPYVEITCACSITEALAQDFCQKHHLKADVTACTPNALHAPHATELLKSGIDILVEKPLAMTPHEGEKIREVADAGKRIVQVGHMWRFDAEVNAIRDFIATGELGRIFKTKGYGIHENWGPSGWFTDKAQAGGGALADMGVHAIDTVRYLLADPQPKQIYAKIETIFGDYDVDDHGIIMITWENGTTSIIESGWWHPHMDGPESATRLFGTKGYASLFPTLLKVKVAGVRGELTPEMPKKSEHCDQSIYDKQMAHFVECVKTRDQPVAGLSAGLTVLRIVDAAYRASESGQIIDL